MDEGQGFDAHEKIVGIVSLAWVRVFRAVWWIDLIAATVMRVDRTEVADLLDEISGAVVRVVRTTVLMIELVNHVITTVRVIIVEVVVVMVAALASTIRIHVVVDAVRSIRTVMPTISGTLIGCGR